MPPPPANQGPPPPGYQAYSPTPSPGWTRAGFGARFGASLLDSLLYGLLTTALVIPGIVLLIAAFDGCTTINDEIICPTDSLQGGTLAGGIALILAALLIVFVVYVRALGRTGQTWGRKIVGVKVVGELTGTPIGFGKALGRVLFANAISGQIFYLGYLWMLWDDKQQTWHDKVVGSIVVRT
ncbi:RDD family protein [Ilumatobacter sp.]|uniref:RDD family protein n=1 Tax=Ilumatobacter sp. TaxID=1967498 RepID=UPI003752E1C5